MEIWVFQKTSTVLTTSNRLCGTIFPLEMSKSQYARSTLRSSPNHMLTHGALADSLIGGLLTPGFPCISTRESRNAAVRASRFQARTGQFPNSTNYRYSDS